MSERAKKNVLVASIITVVVAVAVLGLVLALPACNTTPSVTPNTPTASADQQQEMGSGQRLIHEMMTKKIHINQQQEMGSGQRLIHEMMTKKIHIALNPAQNK